MSRRRSAWGRPLIVLVAVLAVASCSHGEPGAAPSPPVVTPSPSPPTSAPAPVSPSSSTSSRSSSATGAPSSPVTPPPTATATPSTTPTATPLPSALIGVDVTRLPTSKHVVALTFDAGANADGVPKIVATLRAKDVPATFFLTGSWVTSFPQQARDIGAEFAVGDHSVTHPHFNQLSDDAARSEVEQARLVIRAATGVDPKPLFRFPFGEHNAGNRALVNGLGYVSIGWTVDTLGWQGTSGGRTADSVKQRVLAGLQPGEVVLMHVGSNPTDRSTLDADALAAVIDAIRFAGYGFVTIPGGLGLS